MADGTQELKSRRPANTAFKQQRLKAWQPILTPKTVLPTFFIVGVLFAPIGGLLLYKSDSVSEITLDYTNCHTAGSTPQPMPFNAFSSYFPGTSDVPDRLKPTYYVDPASTATPGGTPKCVIQFSVLQDMPPPVFLYYRMTNFYQNHRRYVKSLQSDQLSGVAVGAKDLDNCKPLNTVSDASTGNVPVPIYPCGLIANSQFNDTLSTTITGNMASQPGVQTPANTSTSYTFSENNIAWPSDKTKFGAVGYKILSQIRPPPNWAARYPNNYTDANPPVLDEHFMVWMRTAGLPDFRKLYGRNDDAPLKAGTYIISVDSRYNVLRYSGTKSLIISTVSFLGGKNPFLGIVYITVGCLCVVLGGLFTIRHLWRPRKLGDHTYLSWNQTNGGSPPHGHGDGTGVDG